MTTDRTAVAPQRATNAPPRPSAAQDKTPAPDAFSALLSAATPKADDSRPAPRAHDHPHARRDHDHRSARADRSPARPERGDGDRAHAAGRQDAAKPANQPAAQTDAAPAAPTGDATTTAATVPADAAPTQAAPAVAPNVIAAQLASPLPPQDATAGQGAQAPGTPAQGTVPAGTVVAAAAQPGVPGQPVPGAPGSVDPHAAQPATPADAAQTPTTGPQADAAAKDAAPKVAVPLNLDAQPATQQPPTAATPSAPPAQAGAARADSKPQDAAPAVQNTNATQPLTPPVAAPAQPLSAPAGLQRAVPLQHVARTLGTLLHVASDKGVTHARLNLKPVELGGIEVRLQSSPQGVSAQLVADSPEAARMLTQASDDLRRQLADRNVNLLSLDVSTSSDQRQAPAGTGAGHDGGFGGTRSGGSPATSRHYDGDVQATEAAPVETTLVLPGGVLVDVLA